MSFKFISLHYTAKCANNCTGCYLIPQREVCKEVNKDEWLRLPLIAKKMGIEKIAVAVNLIPISEVLEFLPIFLSECIKNGILLDITTLVEVAKHIVDNMNLKGIDTLSISVDDEKIRSNKQFELACNVAKSAYSKGVNKTNANYLIYYEIKDFGLFEELLCYFNTVHLLFQKPFPYTKDEYYNIIESLYSKGIFKDDRYTIDPCILFRLGLISKCCNREYLIDINPYGSVAGCAFSHKDSIGKITEMEDLPVLLRGNIVPTISKCPHLEFNEQVNENYRSKSKSFNSYSE